MSLFSTSDVIRHIHLEDAVAIDDEQLSKLQSLLFMMLDDIMCAASEAGVTVCLGGGSALGAIRHKGIIPWDDDIDLMIERKDYDVFCSTFIQMYSDKYWIRCPENTKGHNLLFTQIRLKGTSVKNRDDSNNTECGLPVDLFVIENTYNNLFSRTFHGLGCQFYGFAVSACKFKRDKIFYRKLAKNSNNNKLKLVTNFKIIVGTILSWRSLDRWVDKGNKWYSRCKNNDSKYVTVPTGRKHFWGEMYLRSKYLNFQKCEYEGRELVCPGDTDNYLARLYGDYMQLPDVKNEERHMYFEPFNL